MKLRKWSKLTAISGIVVVMTLLVAGPTFAAENVLRIGVASAQTGPVKILGRSQDTSAKIWQERYNSQGGIQIGDKKYMLEFIYGDTRMEPGLARTVGEKMIYSDKLKYIVCPGTPVGNTIEGMARREGVLIVSGSGTGVAVEPGHPLYFDTIPSVKLLAAPYLEFLKSKYPDAKRLARIGIDAVYDIFFSTHEQEGLEKVQPWAEWVGETKYERGVVDFMPTVTGVLAKNPDIISIGSLDLDLVPVIKTLREMGYTGPIFSIDSGLGVRNVIEAIKPNVEYLDNCHFIELLTHPYTPELLAYKKEFEKHAEWVDRMILHGMQIPLLLQAFQDAGSIEVPKVAKALENVNIQWFPYPGDERLYFGGEKTYGIKRMLNGPLAVTTVVNGEPKTATTIMCITP